MPFLTVHACPVRYDHVGCGPPVVLLHGGGMASPRRPGGRRRSPARADLAGGRVDWGYVVDSSHSSPARQGHRGRVCRSRATVRGLGAQGPGPFCPVARASRPASAALCRTLDPVAQGVRVPLAGWRGPADPSISAPRAADTRMAPPGDHGTVAAWSWSRLRGGSDQQLEAPRRPHTATRGRPRYSGSATHAARSLRRSTGSAARPLRRGRRTATR